MITLEPDPLLRLRALVRRGRHTGPVTHLPGGQVTRARGRGLETADLRSFEHGDDPRHIDRNATARTGHPQVRRFHAERDRTTILVADFRPSMLWGTRRTFRSVAAAEALCLAGWKTVIEGGRVGLIAVSAGEPVFRAAAGRDRAMVGVIGAMVRAHALALDVVEAPEPPLSVALGLAHRIAPRGAEVVVASALDERGADFPELAQQLSHRTSLSFLRIVDAFEVERPAGQYRFSTRSGRTGTAPGMNRLTEPELRGMRVTNYYSAEAPDAELRHGG